jgi:hypothetical protein
MSAIMPWMLGLVKAACAPWISSSPSMSGKDKQHQEYVARRKDLKALGLQALGLRGS